MKILTGVAIVMAVFWVAVSVAWQSLGVDGMSRALPAGGAVTFVVVLFTNIVGRVFTPLMMFLLAYYGARLAIRHERVARAQIEA